MWYREARKCIFVCLTVVALCGMILCGCRRENHSDEDINKPSVGDTVSDTPTIKIEDETPNSKETENETTSEAEEGGNEPEDDAELNPDSFFTIEEISDEVFGRMQGKSFPEGCTISREDLRYLKLLYKDIEGNVHEGEMVCNKEIAGKLTEIFRELYDAGYPIEKITLIDDYDGDDDASMSDNNTSCFNYRVVSGTNKLSNHAMGLAVDLNPRYNPYVRTKNGVEVIEPENGAAYADRSGDFPYKIDKDDLAYRLFTEAGFSWGGSWKNSKDYQHFEYKATPTE